MASQSRSAAVGISATRQRITARGHDSTSRKTTFSEFWQGGHVPSPTQRLDQPNTGFHATAQYIDIVALIHQRGGLRGDDLQVGILASNVTVGEDTQRVV